MVWIAGSTVGAGGATNITFSSIPQTFTHLQVRCFAKSTRSDILIAANVVNVQFNDDTSANYVIHRLRGSGSTAESNATTGSAYVEFGIIPGSFSSETNMFGNSVTDILDYTNTNKNKVTRTIGGFDRNGDGYVGLVSGLWLSTAAITKIVIRFDAYANPFTQYSRFDLYGITSSQVTGA
jgi:hypothetical protein